MEGHVFISYVREDSAAVDRLVLNLQQSGVNVWLDREQIAPGERWKDAIRSAIRNGNYYLACFSKQYANRGRSYMHDELLIAIDELRLRPTRRAWFIPVTLDDMSPPELPIGGGQTICDIQWVNLSNNWEHGIGAIVKAIGGSTLQQSAGTRPTLSKNVAQKARVAHRTSRANLQPLASALSAVIDRDMPSLALFDAPSSVGVALGSLFGTDAIDQIRRRHVELLDAIEKHLYLLRTCRTAASNVLGATREVRLRAVIRELDRAMHDVESEYMIAIKWLQKSFKNRVLGGDYPRIKLMMDAERTLFARAGTFRQFLPKQP